MHMRHAHARLTLIRSCGVAVEALELDDKPSVIVDYMNQAGGDEIRLVNTEKRIYLGR